MNAEHWQRIREVLEPALEQPDDEVTAWLDQHCPEELRAEVDALVAASAERDSIIDEPVLRSDAPLTPGTEIGPYVVDELIGVGGMGVVYRAHDPRLDRLVAIKLLTYGGRVCDSIAEARSASALNDPNIVVIHDVLVFRDAPAIVMEYVEGETLADMLDTGPLPADVVRRTARRIAAALVASHEAGVLHRDLKPGNVIVRPDGSVKVLDFGIARRMPESELVEARAAGTRGYMAPEQAAGEPLDTRADVYAFGAVVRDMLLGRDDAAEGGATAALPGVWRPVVERCLADDPSNRFASMREVEGAVHAISRARPLAWVAGIVVLIAIGTVIAMAPWTTDATDAPPVFETVAVPGSETNREFPAISPDGSMVVFSAPVEGRLHLFVQRSGAVRAVPLGLEGRHASFSPDGSSLVFRSDENGGGLFVAAFGDGLDDFITTSGVPAVPVVGPMIETPRKISDRGFHPSWSPNSTEIAFSTEGFERAEERPTSASAVLAIHVEELTIREVTSAGTIIDAIQPVWSPDGRRIAFWSVDAGLRRVWTVAADGGTPTAVTSGDSFDWGPAWSADGWLYWSSDRSGSMNAWRTRVDPATGRPLGEPQSISLPTSYASHLSFAESGEMAFADQSPESSIWRAALDGSGRRERLTPRALHVAYPSVSPDGEWLVAFEESLDRLFVMRTDGSDFAYITDGSFRDRGPAWSPDGETIAFVSSREGDYEIWQVRPDGSDLRVLVHADDGAFSPVWSPRGIHLAWFTRPFLPMVLDIESGETHPLPAPPEHGFRPTSWASDGRRIAGLLRADDGQRLGTTVLNVETGVYTDLPGYCDWLRWMPDGRMILCAEGPDLVLVDPADESRQVIGTLPFAINNQFDISPDGAWVYASLAENQSEVRIARPVARR